MPRSISALKLARFAAPVGAIAGLALAIA